MKRNWSWLFAIAGLCLLVLSAPSTAQKKKVTEEVSEEEKAAIRQERMQRLVMAQDLVAEGRKRNSPEYLITAAGILKLLSDIPAMNKAVPSEVKPEIQGDGDPALDKEIPPVTLEEQSKQLFKEASDMAADLGVNVDKLIDLVKKREDREKRAPVGGPKQVCRSIGAGQTHSFNFQLVNNASTYWAYQSSIPLHISVVRSDDNNAWFLNTTMQAARTFHPSFQSKTKIAPITIRIKNQTKGTAKYQFVLN